MEVLYDNYPKGGFGVILVILIEMGQITPPMGFNLFVIHGISGGRPINEVLRGAWPFLVLQLLAIIIVANFPFLALWLPGRM